MPRRHSIIAVLIFLSGVLLFFVRSFSSYFVSDDYEFLGRVNLHNAGDYFLKSWGYADEYRPLLVYTYALNGAVSGFNPVGYHFVNSIIHGLNGYVLALILELLGFPYITALLAGILFVLNPVGHQSVLWIAGRPVILSTLFALLSIWCFLKAATNTAHRHLYWTGIYLTFVLALLTYEGAVVIPFLMTLLGTTSFVSWPVRRWWKQFAGMMVILCGYLMLWRSLFGFRITRFPVEQSVAGATLSLANGVASSFHGSKRFWIAPLYIALLIVVWRSPRGKTAILIASGWFFIAFVPFLMVHGYADRFSYLSSAAAAGILAFGLLDIYGRSAWLGLVAGFALILFFAVGMQHRITAWREAGEIAQGILIDIKRARPAMPQDATVILLNAPRTHKQALVFYTGLERAVALAYPKTRMLILRRIWTGARPPVVIFNYSAGHMGETTSP